MILAEARQTAEGIVRRETCVGQGNSIDRIHHQQQCQGFSLSASHHGQTRATRSRLLLLTQLLIAPGPTALESTWSPRGVDLGIENAKPCPDSQDDSLDDRPCYCSTLCRPIQVQT